MSVPASATPLAARPQLRDLARVELERQHRDHGLHEPVDPRRGRGPQRPVAARVLQRRGQKQLAFETLHAAGDHERHAQRAAGAVVRW